MQATKEWRTTHVVDVVLPSLHGLEGGVAGEIEHDKGSNRLLVVDAREVAISLLPRNVPAEANEGGGGERESKVSDNATRLAESREGGRRYVPQLQVHERVGAPLDGLQSEICRGSPDPGFRERWRVG